MTALLAQRLPEELPYMVMALLVIGGVGLASWLRREDAVPWYVPASLRPGTSNGYTSDVSMPRQLTGSLLYWSMVGVLIMFSASRRGIGTDYRLYTALFEQLDPTQPWSPQILSSPQDPGFTVLALICSSVSDGPVLLMTVSAVLTILPIAIVMRRSSLWLPTAMAAYVLLGAYLFPMNLVRQGLAVSIIFYGWRYLDRRRELYVLFVLVAATFHLSALVIGTICFLFRNVQPMKRTFVGVGVFAVVVVTAIFVPFEHFIGAFESRYIEYIVVARQQLGHIGVGTLANLAARVATLIYVARTPRLSRVGRRLVVFLTLSVPFMTLGALIPVVARFELYFVPTLILLVPEALIKRNAGRLQYTAIGIVMVAYFVVTLLSFYGLLPYASYLVPR